MNEYEIAWKDLEGSWIREKIRAKDLREAIAKAGTIADLFGTGECIVYRDERSI